MQASTTTSGSAMTLEAIYEENARRGKELAAGRAAARDARLEAKLERMVPTTYRNAILRDEACISWLDGYRNGDRRNLLLVGGTGTTKTTQAYALMAQLMRSGVNCTFGTAGDLLRHVKRAYDGDFSEEEAMEQLSGVPVLFVDDLGKESPTQWAVEHLFDLVDERVAHRKPIVVTTNLDAANLRRHFGEPGQALVSRLAGGAVVSVFGGPDRRLA